MVQVNLGNDETWDTHVNAFPILKDFLFPPTDRAVSALLDDLSERGMLDSTLIVMAGEMGRTPKISTLPQFSGKPGRDHWGTQTVLFAGGGVRGGTVIGSTDKIGAYPAANPQKPENMAATIYQALGIPRTLAWHDSSDRPHFVYHGDPIPGLGVPNLSGCDVLQSLRFNVISLVRREGRKPLAFPAGQILNRQPGSIGNERNRSRAKGSKEVR